MAPQESELRGFLLASVLFLQESVPSPPITDVSAAIACYLYHRGEVDIDLAEQEAEADRIQKEDDSGSEIPRLRHRLRFTSEPTTKDV